MGLLADAASIGGDIFNAGAEIWKTGKQLELQKETWKREDSAVQRRVQDLQKAGLSPVLAAGSAAGTGAPVNVSAPKANLGNVYTANQMESARKQQALTEAQLDLTYAQMRKTEAESFIPMLIQDRLQKDASGEGSKSRNLVESSINKAIAENNQAVRYAEETMRNTNLARKYGAVSNSAQAMDMVSAGNMIENVLTGGKPNLGPLASILINAMRRK